MPLRVSGKHVDVGDAFRTHITVTIDAIAAKYFGGGYSGHMTLSREGGRFKSECTLHLDTGALIRASAEAAEPRASFDLLAERWEKRMRRYKRRLRRHTGRNEESREGTSYVLETPEAEPPAEVHADYAPVIVAETTMRIQTHTVGSAVFELDANDASFVVFKNAGTGGINVVYRRDDGHIGWIDSGQVSQSPAPQSAGDR